MKNRLLVFLNSVLITALSTDIVYGYAEVESSNDGVSFFSSLMKFIGFLVIFGAIIFLAYYTTKLVASKSNQSMRSENMEVIDAMSLGTTSKIMMVRVEKYVYVLAVNGSSITSIDKLDYDELDIVERSFYSGDFDQQLKKLINSEKLSELKDKFTKKRDDR